MLGSKNTLGEIKLDSHEPFALCSSMMRKRDDENNEMMRITRYRVALRQDSTINFGYRVLGTLLLSIGVSGS